MKHSARTIIIAAGGTGGHILPGIRIGNEIDRAHAGVYKSQYVCGSREIESQIYGSEQITPLKLRAGTRKGAGALTCLLGDSFRVLKSFLRNRPAAVLAMGGAACVPVLAMAVVLRIPIFLHESNRKAGRVVRLFAPLAKKVFLGLGGMEGKNVSIVGTPTRPAPDAVNRDVILCMGGSQGASKLNEIFVTVANRDHIRAFGYRFVLLSGPGKHIPNRGVVEVREYEPRIETLLARAEIVISRAGAGALADIANCRIPAVLVPYPFAKDDHQQANADFFGDADAAFVLDEKSLTKESLDMLLHHIMADASLRERMRANLASFDSSSAARVIAHELAESISGKKKESRSKFRVNSGMTHEPR
ncbi:UDP-N-acetylglucosamine--N-acetylmuramyl-(pentapeptide) pyrophosphoryl-undecaprenol N-acetylglucosamine transferase [Candidatus Sumerlaeota bacterium]|nr:UDP-N-acetylglucosamine--N-acetylmuramyl-(pentapeptide) pyrophosphoryl-undecaprenol N-acetylglucosamine transferase [Candidatus Sumerlaeota bacterium]